MKQKKGISLMTMLLVMGIVPLIVSAVIMTVIAANSIESEVKGETFDKLKVASESVSQYFSYDVKSNGDVDYAEYADHDFIESMKSESVELTLFKGDTRFITSLKNENGAYNEGTQASAEVFAEVSRGKEYEADDVVIGGVDYYVFYEPIYDGNGAFWGMAFAGTPQAKVSKAISSATIKLVMIAVISTIIFSIVIVLVASKIRKSIQTIADGLLCLSDGDIAQGIDIKNDIITEVNDMISATNNLQQKLLEIVGTVKEHTVKLSGSIDVVQLSANQSSQGTGQISGAMDELAHSTMSLSENVQNVNTHAIEMGEYIQGITGNVTALSNASDEIKESTENAQNYMAQVMDCSDNSTASVAEILESIKLTNDSIIKITEAVDLITEITSQTNLLSLNASIEAARAGEAGKGFAVVAEEIGKLATESAKSADTIRGLAEDMKEKSSRTVVLAGKIDDIIKEEKTCVNATQSAFEALGASIEESLAMIAEINTKSAELMVLKENIISNISDLSAISEENAASNQEVTASVQSIAERINEMSSQSDEMKGVSEDLQDAVAYFR